MCWFLPFVSACLVGQRRKWQPTPLFLPRESRGQRSLMGCCPWGHTESDTTEVTQHAYMHWKRKWQPTPVFLPRESQGQRTWWAAIYGVTQSRTWLKRLSSSSSPLLILANWIVSYGGIHIAGDLWMQIKLFSIYHLGTNHTWWEVSNKLLGLAKKVHSGFSISCYKKTWMNFWPVHHIY